MSTAESEAGVNGQKSFTILYWGPATSYTLKEKETLLAHLPISTARLFEMLEEKYAGIKSKVLESCMVTVNFKYVDVSDSASTELVINKGDEVAIIPPVSSG
ncbi:hypothetical protein HYALB_00006066 [Hymenoscyphus albidus]|uniref:Molybdopterin synthase sulfur carrier subunit n=1 Tax=Hymenoscyphus albidus TaxID=595503 RepID=A0A9N9LZG5_9HELO|nr:hypothetical protein HYALB_00006066 [Hymenoscyphus albidus]